LNSPEAVPLPQPLANQDNEAVFQEAWHAQVISLAFNLVERGEFSNVQWSDALGAELAKARDSGIQEDSNTYYCAALAALEALLDAGQSLSAQAVDGRTEAWRSAYLRTPHGQPVELDRHGNNGARSEPDER
jgi:hypothetical protein